MPWIEFTDDFHWHVPRYRGRATVAYKRGMVQFVTRDCAAAALAAGKAVRARKPKPGIVGTEVTGVVFDKFQTEASHGDQGAQSRAAQAQAGGDP